jgi:hypothetical protein
MHIERLTHLRDLLRADAANPTGVKFDLSAWVGHASTNNPDEIVNIFDMVEVDGNKVPTQPIAISCDTYVCALGLAALDPVFQAQGLHFEVCPTHNPTLAWMIPQFGADDGFQAGAAFFDISLEDSLYLFDQNSYSDCPVKAEGELYVADRVDDLINGIVDNYYHPEYKDEGDKDEGDNED